MLTFLKKILIFISPFLILIALEIMIDPFNYFSPEKDKQTAALKNALARKKNTYLYRLIEYEQNPTPVIVLGDSRAQRLMPEFFEEVNGKKVLNLAAGAGSLQDVIKIFWDLSSRHKLDTVYLGISIEGYSGTLLKDRVSAALEVKNSAPLYLTSKFTVENTMLILKSKLFKQPVEVQAPPFSREEFWKYELAQEDRYLNAYSYPRNYYNDLKKISDFCVENKIKLVFFISPTHTEVQEKIAHFKLEKEYEKFREDIKLFGDLYDFNWPNVITRDKNNFLDPLHSIDSVSRIMIREMILNRPQYAVFTGHHTGENKK
ncbi:MAG: hypothetical protein WBO39_12710 [Ferruginibacter sp.]